MTEITSDTSPYLSAYLAGRTESEPDWLRADRDAAIRHFVATGFPTRKDEAWRFTDLHRLPKTPIWPAAGREIGHAGFDAFLFDGSSYRLILGGGSSVTGDLPAGIWFASFAETLEKRPDLLKSGFDGSDLSGGQAFASLNAALFRDGAVLVIEPGIVLDRPIEIVHRHDGGDHLTRSVIVLGEGAKATVLETHVGIGEGCNIPVTMVELAEGASLGHAKLQAESAEAVHLATTRVRVRRAAQYEALVISTGGFLSREEIRATLEGEGARFTLNGAYLLKDRQESVFAPFVDHQVPGCASRQVVKGVAAGKAHGAFLGAIAVRPGADQTDAHQTNRNLLLSDTATIDTRPELQILAEDVKCSHGATVGDLDDAALFYLQARGIKAGMARQMLVRAFAADILEASSLGAGIGAFMQSHLAAWLESAL